MVNLADGQHSRRIATIGRRHDHNPHYRALGLHAQAVGGQGFRSVVRLLLQVVLEPVQPIERHEIHSSWHARVFKAGLREAV
jgi:transketolase N-terminal domain/subunit